MGAEGKTSGGSCWRWCAARRDYWGALTWGVFALAVALGVVAFGMAWVAIQQAQCGVTQQEYLYDAPVQSCPINHVAFSPTGPLVLTLPNDLTAFEGKRYLFVCGTE